MPVPPQIQAGCGIALRIKEKDFDPVLSFLNQTMEDEFYVYIHSWDENGSDLFNLYEREGIF